MWYFRLCDNAVMCSAALSFQKTLGIISGQHIGSVNAAIVVGFLMAFILMLSRETSLSMRAETRLNLFT